MKGVEATAPMLDLPSLSTRYLSNPLPHSPSLKKKEKHRALNKKPTSHSKNFGGENQNNNKISLMPQIIEVQMIRMTCKTKTKIKCLFSYIIPLNYCIKIQFHCNVACCKQNINKQQKPYFSKDYLNCTIPSSQWLTLDSALPDPQVVTWVHQ